MNIKRMALWLLLLLGICWGQNAQSIHLKSADFSLALPTMATGENGTLYVAFRTFDWLRRSKNLVVIAYDLKSHRELHRRTLVVPSASGSRASDGLYLSTDGRTLAYAEVHDPCLILLMSGTDLSEIRRSAARLFSPDDHQQTFAGFDSNGLLSFASDGPGGLRFLRIETANLKVVSDTTAAGLHQERSQRLVWSPTSKSAWIFKPSGLGSDEWSEYTEEGRATGQKLISEQGSPNGAVALGKARALAYFGKWADGAVITYNNHHATGVRLQCSPHLYGTSSDPQYAGAICTTSPDREPENGGGTILSSEFLLLKTDVPAVAWRQKMSYIDLAEKNGDDLWFHQDGNPMIRRFGKKLLVVAPTKPAELIVYEVGLPD